MPDPKKKPIIVNSKNDLKYKAYQDSLTVYNANKYEKNYYNKNIKPFIKTKDIEDLNNKWYNNVNGKIIDDGNNAELRLEKLNKKPYKFSKYPQTEGERFFGITEAWYPKQKVLLKQKEYNKDTPQVKSLGFLESRDVTKNNQKIESPLPIFKTTAKVPKSFDINYSTQRINNGTGYYDQNNRKGVDIETALRAQEQADRQNTEFKKKYENSTNPKAIERLNTLKDTVTITPQYAYGGQLNDNMQNNNLTRFDEGGLHHQNPLGGVPVGNGNTVEEGETKMKNYVYSNRLSIDENMTKEMNLPSYIKGKTFASASKAIDNKFKDRNDNHSLETKKVFLERLKEAQETLKQQEQQRAEEIAQSMQSNQQEIPDMMNGEIPEGMEEFTEQPKQFFAGGDITSSEVGNQTGGMSGLSGKMSPYLQGASALGNSMPQQNNGSLYNPQGQQAWESTKDAVTKIPVIGQFASIFRGIEKAGKGIGTAIGGEKGGDVATGILDPFSGQMETFKSKDSTTGEKLATLAAPFLSGLIASKGRERTNAKNMNKAAINFNRQFQDNNFAKGGYLTSKPSQYAGGGYITSGDPLIIPNEGISPTYNQFEDTFPNGIYTKPNSNNWYKNNPTLFEQKAQSPFAPDTTITPTNKVQGKSFLSKTGDYLDKNGGKFLKYAPVAMNAYQLAKLTKPENQRLQRLSDKYKAQYVDEAQLQNIANQEMTNTINSISQSGASQGAIRSSILGAGLNKTKALSDAYMKANAENRATDDKGQTFNLGVNQFNTQTQHQESENWERNAASYRNEKSKLLSAIGTDLGSIGKEEVNKNQIAEALGYSWDGKYMINKKTGEKKTYEDVVGQTKQNSYGGYLKMNKIGRK